MRYEKDWRALICYAGSAPEASIGSKPIGSELVVFICMLIAKSQHFVEWVTAIFATNFARTTPYGIANKRKVDISCLAPGGR